MAPYQEIRKCQASWGFSYFAVMQLLLERGVWPSFSILLTATPLKKIIMERRYRLTGP